MSKDCIDDIDLPNDSLFDRDDYIRMSEVASSGLGHDILVALEEADRLSQQELEETLKPTHSGDIPGTLKDLMRVALIRHGLDPDTGNEETYSYYTLTKPGRTILDNGVVDGVRVLTKREHDAEQKYNR